MIGPNDLGHDDTVAWVGKIARGEGGAGVGWSIGMIGMIGMDW